jgi:hypothetical protein
MEVDFLRIYGSLYRGLERVGNGFISIPTFEEHDTRMAAKFLRDMADDMDRLSKEKYPDGMPF